MSVKVKKRSGQRWILFRKNSVLKTRRKKNSKKKSQHAAQLNGAPSINAKTLDFPSLLKNRTQKYTLCPLKDPKIDFFSLITRRKKFQRPKLRNMIDREPILVFAQKLDESDQQVSRKLDLKR